MEIRSENGKWEFERVMAADTAPTFAIYFYLHNMNVSTLLLLLSDSSPFINIK